MKTIHRFQTVKSIIVLMKEIKSLIKILIIIKLVLVYCFLMIYKTQNLQLPPKNIMDIQIVQMKIENASVKKVKLKLG